MNSSEYFRKRAEQNMKKAHDKATPVMGRVNRAFDKSVKRLRKEIKNLTKNFEGLSRQDIKQYLDESIPYDRYKELINIYNATDNKNIKKKIKQMLVANSTGHRIRRKEALIQAIERERLYMSGVQIDEFGRHLSSVTRQNLILFGFEGISREVVEDVVNSKWLGGNYSSRVWKNQKVLAKQLEINIYETLVSGKTFDQVANELEHLTDVGRFAANRLIRTETSYVVNSSDLKSAKQRGVKAKRFNATLDSRTSKVCREHNQLIIPVDELKIGMNAPPLHPYCRSFLEDIVEGWDYETKEELEKLIADSKLENQEKIKNLSDEITAGKINQYVTPNSDVEQYLRYKNTIKPDRFSLSFDEFEKIKYNKGEEYEYIKLEYRDEKLRTNIKNNYNLDIHEGRQGKHIKGHNNYEGKSYILENINPKDLIDRFAGTSDIRRDKNGRWIRKEFIMNESPIGYYMDLEGKEHLTRYFSIEYSKKGIHIVPRREPKK